MTLLFPSCSFSTIMNILFACVLVHPVPVFFLSMCPLLLPLTHTAKPRHHATHTRGGWCTLVPGVCVPTVLAVAAPGSPLTRPPTPCAPHHTTPPLAAGAAGGGCGCGGSVGVVACVATWSTRWLRWCCPLPHTHTHDVLSTWWLWLCVLHFPSCSCKSFPFD